MRRAVSWRPSPCPWGWILPPTAPSGTLTSAPSTSPRAAATCSGSAIRDDVDGSSGRQSDNGRRWRIAFHGAVDPSLPHQITLYLAGAQRVAIGDPSAKNLCWYSIAILCPP